MAITTPVYCGRADVMRAKDVRYSARMTARIDDAIQSAARDIDGAMHRVFYPTDTVRYKDWPNYQRARPWVLWLDADELAAAPTQVTAGGIAIPIGQVFAEPVNLGPPFTRIELDRSSSASFAMASTPQRAVAITGSFGYDLNTDPAGTLAAAMTDTTGTAATVSDSSVADAGHILLIDSERMLVTDRSMTQAGSLTLSGTGCTTSVVTDNVLAVSGSGTLHVDETILLGAERMLVVDTSGSSYVVQRASDGTKLATHTAGDLVYAPRLLSVTRGALGTVAATHLISATALKYRAPALIKKLNVAEAINYLEQESTAYSRTVGEGDNQRPATGDGLQMLWADTARKHRRNRIAVI